MIGIYLLEFEIIIYMSYKFCIIIKQIFDDLMKLEFITGHPHKLTELHHGYYDLIHWFGLIILEK